jgi:hypothetical protein
MHHQIAALGSLIYMIGGEDEDNIFNSVEIFDPLSKLNNKQWIQTGSKVTPRCNFGLVALDSNTLLAIGGHIGADMNEARSFCSVCLDDEQEKIYVFGGADANGNGLRPVEVYNSYKCRWLTLPPMIFNRISPCVYGIGYYIIVLVGRTSLGQNSEILNTAEIFHIEKDSLIRTNDLPIRVYGATTILR